MNLVDEFGGLKELVRQHKVCWEVWPVYHIDRKGEKVQIGFELELAGTHHEPKEPPKPGCAECVTVEALAKVFFCGSTSSPRTEKLNNFNLSPFTLSLSKGKLRTFARSSVYNDLRRIAQWIIPKEDRLSRYEIGIFDSSIHYSAKRKFRGEVALIIRILHKGKFDDPTDDCEVRCLNEMKEKLKELGAHERDWPELAKETKK